MPTRRITVTPPSSVVFVMDGTGGDLPTSMGGRSIVATESAIAVGTRAATSGATTLSLGDETTPEAGAPAFDGLLDTPNGRVTVISMMLDTLLEVDVPRGKSRVRIFTDHPSRPVNVDIVVGLLSLAQQVKLLPGSTPSS
jgi:hypothetical protein